uniref:Uncharacterized protein n=1 Tax=Anopheles minimus TaxID=112268 RepID=A0A182VRE5_9DIPT
MRKTMAPTRSVHFIDSETISKQIFAPARYNLPLFLCKKLNVHSTSVENSTPQPCSDQPERTALLRRMAKYHVNELTKDPPQLLATDGKRNSLQYHLFAQNHPQNGIIPCKRNAFPWARSVTMNSIRFAETSITVSRPFVTSCTRRDVDTAAKFVGASLATIGVGGSGLGIGTVFDTTNRKEKSFKINQPQSGVLRRRCNAHRAGWPHCPKPLRDGHKEWSLPPGRYRLGGSIADLANRSTGIKGRNGHPTKGRHPSNQPRVKPSLHDKFGATGNAELRDLQLDTLSAINLPAEMNKLLHPSKYFVGKIRP